MEQLLVTRNNGDDGWNEPVAQTKPLDQAINDWVDLTGNEIVATSCPNMFMQWMDAKRRSKLIIAAIMVTYVPAVKQATPVLNTYLS